MIFCEWCFYYHRIYVKVILKQKQSYHLVSSLVLFLLYAINFHSIVYSRHILPHQSIFILAFHFSLKKPDFRDVSIFYVRSFSFAVSYKHNILNFNPNKQTFTSAYVWHIGIHYIDFIIYIFSSHMRMYFIVMCIHFEPSVCGTALNATYIFI